MHQTESPAASVSTPPANAAPFLRRHVGPAATDVEAMLDALGLDSLDALLDETVPADIRLDRPLDLPAPLSERALLDRARAVSERNEIWRSCIGLGYHGTVTPPVIRRTVFENPTWYTHYTPYQAEIAQGRLEALLNFQTAVIDLTGLPVANASLLDEASAAAEAMLMMLRVTRGDARTFFAADDCHPQTVAVVRSRAEPIGVEIAVGTPDAFEFTGDVFGALVQYPATDGAVRDYGSFCDRAHAADALVVVAADPLALTLLRPPGEFGADVAVGSTQRFGVPLGYGGPHAAYFATREAFKRQVPGRMIGVTIDADRRPALRMALQTREQHIRRGKATSNICTAQVLLAVMAGAYAVYHGPDGLRDIAARVQRLTRALADGLDRQGHRLRHADVFDTLRVDPVGLDAEAVHLAAAERRVNLRHYPDGSVGVTLDETTAEADLDDLLAAFTPPGAARISARAPLADVSPSHGPLARTSPFLTHEVFHRYRSETDLMRYLHRLSARDLSLADGMIPLGSCTMKLNPAASLEPLSWPAFADLHPFAPREQAAGLHEALGELADALCEITGFAGASLQPNSGATGEYAGMLVVRAFHRSRGEAHRTVCLIPDSAHGTNPASAVMAGMEVVVVQSDADGNVDLADLRAKAEAHADRLAALMITYPSTHGVFEEDVRAVCDAVHDAGGQVYIDGANMNAMAGLVRPADLGGDLCHLNLHKTFAIPHGGGGPGSGPILVAGHLAPFLPGHPFDETAGPLAIGPVAAAPYGSALIGLVSWGYLALLGTDGLRHASAVAVLAANYLAERLAPHYSIVFRGSRGRVAHEFILDLRPFRAAGITEHDVAKRLMDYGFHAPTVSWPVAGGLMVEPTESESRAELDRFADAMIAVREEIRSVERGEVAAENSALRQAPHPAAVVTATAWDHSYSREHAAYPAPWLYEHKVWPAVRRVDDAYGDRNLVCACLPVHTYSTDATVGH